MVAFAILVIIVAGGRAANKQRYEAPDSAGVSSSEPPGRSLNAPACLATGVEISGLLDDPRLGRTGILAQHPPSHVALRSARTGEPRSCGKAAASLGWATDAARPASIQSAVVYARSVDEAAGTLRDLRRQEWEDLGLAAVVMALSLAATQVLATLALPLLAGSLAVGGMGVRALWRRWDLVDRLSGEPDAYSIAEVLDCASREATWERRRGYASLIRSELRERPAYDARIEQVADELDALARELDDRRLELAPACAVACRRLVSDPAESALLDPSVPGEDLRASIRRIRFGFVPCSRTTPSAASRDQVGTARRQTAV